LAREIPTTEPAEAILGDTWEWDRSFSDYPAGDGWTLTYSFVGVERMDLGASEITAVGDGWAVRVPADKTQGFPPGAYRWAAFATDADGRRFTLATGTLIGRENFATHDGGQTHAEKMVELLEAALEAQATNGMPVSVSINGRSLTYDRGRAEQMLGIYRAQVDQHRNPGRSMRRHEVRFVAP